MTCMTLCQHTGRPGRTAGHEQSQRRTTGYKQDCPLSYRADPPGFVEEERAEHVLDHGNSKDIVAQESLGFAGATRKRLPDTNHLLVRGRLHRALSLPLLPVSTYLSLPPVFISPLSWQDGQDRLLRESFLLVSYIYISLAISLFSLPLVPPPCVHGSLPLC